MHLGILLCLMGLSVINLDAHMPAICVYELKKPFFCRYRGLIEDFEIAEEGKKWKTVLKVPTIDYEGA